MRTLQDGDTEPQIEVVRCDYQVWIAQPLIAEIQAGNHSAQIELDGDDLTIHATNRDVIYRLGPTVDGQPGVRLATRIRLD